MNGKGIKRTELHCHTKMSAMAGVYYPREMVRAAEKRGDLGAIAITDTNSVQGFPSAAGINGRVKVLCGTDITVFNDDKTTQVMLIARNEAGRADLYSILTEAYSKGADATPGVSFDVIIEKRRNLLVGASCEGEVLKAVLDGAADEAILDLVKKYDYIEVQPPENMVTKDHGSEDCVKAVTRLCSLANGAGKDVVAVSNTFFAENGEQFFHEVLTFSSENRFADTRPLYLRTTDELLSDFSFLGEESALKIVVDNPNRIADLCEALPPVKEGKFYVVFPDGDTKLRNICEKRAAEIYGSPVPDPVRVRMYEELKHITENGFEAEYLISKMIVDKSKSLGYEVGSRGTSASSLVTYLCGITDINPLRPHYYCDKCHIYEEAVINKGDIGSITGYDLPDKACPVCGQPMKKDGLDIPVETFMGINGEKEPDIDLNISVEVWDKIFDHLKGIFGEENVIRAGAGESVTYEEARELLNDYCGNTSEIEPQDIEDCAEIIAGTMKNRRGVIPGGVIIIPENTDVNEITPVQFARSGDNRELIVSHIDYHFIWDAVKKYDILCHDYPSILHDLEKTTGVSQKDIPMDDNRVMSLFQTSEELMPDNHGSDSVSLPGTIGISEFGSKYVREVLKKCKPGSFGDLIKISSLTHGTGSWEDNAENLINSGENLQEVIASRDDIMFYLIGRGMKREQAYAIMERIRKGKMLTDDNIADMKKHGVPEWYIESCDKILYLFPKAHAAAYVKYAWKLAYYKLYYPKEFYPVIARYRYSDRIPEEVRMDLSKLDDAIARYEENDVELEYESSTMKDYLCNLRELLQEAKDRGVEIRSLV